MIEQTTNTLSPSSIFEMNWEQQFEEELNALSEKYAELLAHKDALQGRACDTSTVLYPDPETYKLTYKKYCDFYRRNEEDEF